MESSRGFEMVFPRDRGERMEAERIEIPAGTESVMVDARIRLPDQRPQGGIVTLLGIMSGPRGRGRLVGALTIGRQGQLRIEAGEEQQGGQVVTWGSELRVRMDWNRSAGTFEVVTWPSGLTGSGRVLYLPAGANDMSEGGRLIGGMDVRNPAKREYIPPYGARIEGTLNLDGGSSEGPGGEEPGNPGSGSEIESCLVAIEEQVARIRELL